MKFEATVGEVMRRKLKQASPEDSIQSAAKIMKERKVGSVLITKDGKLKGILTSMDIVNKYVADGKGETCGDIMSDEVVTISPDKTIEEAARLMTERGIEKLPVLENGRITGIITNNDILRIEPTLFEILLEKLKIRDNLEE